jgi:hypothetical protein
LMIKLGIPGRTQQAYRRIIVIFHTCRSCLHLKNAFN